MDKSHLETLSVLFSFIIIVLSVYVVREFLLPMTWAAVIAITTWPLYQRCRRSCQGIDWVAATTLIFLFTLLIALPLGWVLTILVKEIQFFSNYLLTANQNGFELPQWIQSLPIGQQYLTNLWQQFLGEPHSLNKLLTASHQNIKPVSQMLKVFGTQVLHRSVMFGFTILCLFFFYKDGDKLLQQVNALGKHFLGERWSLYSKTVPGALLATLNGLILVGLGVGIIMGITYYFFCSPRASTIWGDNWSIGHHTFWCAFCFCHRRRHFSAKCEVVCCAIDFDLGWGSDVYCRSFCTPLHHWRCDTIAFFSRVIRYFRGGENLWCTRTFSWSNYYGFIYYPLA